jgi:hypothetical protein
LPRSPRWASLGSGMDPRPDLKERARDAVERYLLRHTSPRTILSLLILLAGAAGFGISVGLLRLGLTTMAFRYPVAVIGAYLLLLLLIRLWVACERKHFRGEAAAAELRSAVKRTGGSGTLDDGEPSWTRWLDAVDVFDFADGEGCLVGILIAAVIGFAVVLVAAVAGAPALMAELLVNVLLASMLHRRLQGAALHHWLGTALARTWWMVLIAAALMGLIGACLEMLAPGAVSIGPALKQIF